MPGRRCRQRSALPFKSLSVFTIQLMFYSTSPARSADRDATMLIIPIVMISALTKPNTPLTIPIAVSLDIKHSIDLRCTRSLIAAVQFELGLVMIKVCRAAEPGGILAFCHCRNDRSELGYRNMSSRLR